MDEKEKREVQVAVLGAFAVGLAAQLRAVRRVLAGDEHGIEARSGKPRTSQLDIVEDILRRAGEPLHISEILARASKSHGVSLDRESVVSALTKKIRKGLRFERVDKNVFALKTGVR